MESSSKTLGPLTLNNLKTLDIPEPSPSFTKKASDLGDQETIAGGSSLGPSHSFCGSVPFRSDITPDVETFSLSNLSGDGSSNEQSASTLRIDGFHSAAPDSLQFCAKAMEFMTAIHTTAVRATLVRATLDM